MLDQEYRWYCIGCERLGREPMPFELFEAYWHEMQQHALRLQEAEANNALATLDPNLRAQMQQRVRSDPMIRALLIGMAEESGSLQGFPPLLENGDGERS
ncbi:hypothetical protein [Chthonomonas calidirosea]|uniref:hypothetical protein n=1 Tax=Chthonomonas calidirosea TaxID=454171 RepID=UPI0006ECB2B5|nr:hypothetical protein [Chthonomonas calidirosea]CEK17571.1 hypothetical protein CP488_01895 [Chthonomonas calidirosea]